MLFNRRPSKVNKSNSLSFLAKSDEKHIELWIPNDHDIFHHLVHPAYPYLDKSDARKPKAIEYQRIWQSDKGQYLEGTISLFPSLWHAQKCFEEHIWRNVFQKLRASMKQKTAD